jgi:hypothetical protein
MFVLGRSRRSDGEGGKWTLAAIALAVGWRGKADTYNGEPMHFICPVCMKQNQIISYITGISEYKVCQTDTAHTFGFEQAEDLNRRLRNLGSRLA